MNDEEVINFISQVKGRKIRWCNWNTDKYFIPDGKYELKSTGVKFGGIFVSESLRREEFFWIDDGLSQSLINPEPAKWYFIDKEIQSHMPKWF